MFEIYVAPIYILMKKIPVTCPTKDDYLEVIWNRKKHADVSEANYYPMSSAKTRIKQIFIKMCYITKQIWNLQKATHCNQRKHKFLYEY